MILYSQEYDGNYELRLYNWETQESYKIDIPHYTYEHEIRFYDSTKLIVLPQTAFPDYYYIFDIKTMGKKSFKSSFSLGKYFQTQFFDVNKDHIIFSDGENLYNSVFPNVKSYDTIPIHAKGIQYYRTNHYNYTAIISDTTGSITPLSIINSFYLLKFEIIDLEKKTRERMPYKPFWIGNWSPDGKRIIIKDTISTKILEYPSLKIQELSGINKDSLLIGSSYFLDNNTIIFQATLHEANDWKLYIYDLTTDKMKKLLFPDKYQYNIIDVFNKN